MTKPEIVMVAILIVITVVALLYALVKPEKEDPDA